MSTLRNYLRPQDVLIALKISIIDNSSDWTQAQVAQQLAISPTEVTFALERLRKHHLASSDKRSVLGGGLVEFVVHGLKYVFPAEVGALTRGMPTGSAHEVLRKKLRVADEQILVWPDPEGTVRGQSLRPLYDTVPHAAKRDTRLYELLSLVDAIRVGGARETALATEAIKKILLKGKAD